MTMDLEKLTISVSSAKSFADCNMQYYISSVEKIRKRGSYKEESKEINEWYDV